MWQQVNKNMEKGFTPLPDSLLNQAFMRRVDDELAPRRGRTSSCHSARAPSARRLSKRAALTADLLHAQLARRGVHEVKQLAWITGAKCDLALGQELSEEVLEALQGLLSAATGEESRLADADDVAALAPAEAFLHALHKEAGPLNSLCSRVELALQLLRFPEEAAALENELQMGLETARSILDSSAMPVLLEGVLMLGNYVNANSKCLGSAVGVTLESLAKLAHTRCLSATPRDSSRERRPSTSSMDGGITPRGARRQSMSSMEGGSTPRASNTPRGDNALLLLVEHLQHMRPGFMATLSNDIDGCKAARDLDPNAMEEVLAGLVARLKSVEARLDEGHEEFDDRGDAEGLKPARLRAFVHEAAPKVLALQSLLAEFRDVSLAMCRWFAEAPDTSFVDMMRSLTTLREALPAKSHAPPPYPPCPRPCRLRQVPLAALPAAAQQPSAESQHPGSQQPSPLASPCSARCQSPPVSAERSSPPSLARTPPRRMSALPELPFSTVKLPLSVTSPPPQLYIACAPAVSLEASELGKQQERPLMLSTTGSEIAAFKSKVQVALPIAFCSPQAGDNKALLGVSIADEIEAMKSIIADLTI